jgi:ABC-type branched-subunit amino acid transport system ATPase component/ABC-type branched-subunit amino acid transport system permease subunit
MLVVQYMLLGLGLGAIYTLLAQGLVITYRGSGVLNFSQGAMAMVGAYVFWELHVSRAWPYAWAFVIAVTSIAVLGALVHLVVMRRLITASPLMRVIATLGVLAILEGLATLRYGGNDTPVASALPQSPLHIFSLSVSSDRLYLFGIAVGITFLLYGLGRFTRFGMAMTAVAENSLAASAIGWSPDLVSTVTWAAGSALGAVAGILVVPLIGLQVSTLTLLVISGMAAGLVGGFKSFPITLAGGVLIGVLQSVVSGYVFQTGVSDAVPFLVVIVVLIVRGQGLPLRGYVLERLPALGSGRLRWQPAAAGIAILALGVVFLFPVTLVQAVTLQLGTAVILMSIVVVTGYAGQLSLGQYGIAGISALVGGSLIAYEHWPFWAAILVGVGATIPVGIVFGLPAVRTRGVNLAVVTLGLGLAIQEMLFNNSSFTGGLQGTQIGALHLFGIDLDPLRHPDRYALFCLVCLSVVGWTVLNLRRSKAGRSLFAVRENEKAAAALGISVAGIKLYAFCLGAVIAGVGGILLSFGTYSIEYSIFSPLASISATGYAVIGGIGSVIGSIVGSFFVVGGVGSWALNHFSSLENWLPVIGGVLLLVTVVANPEGIVGAIATRRASHASRLKQRGHLRFRLQRGKQKRHADSIRLLQLSRERHAPLGKALTGGAELSVRNVSVSYGGSLAVDDVSLEIAPGSVVGLIGPNGSGKTSLIDAITGFTKSSGSVTLGGTRVDRLPPHKRARLGLSRCFQGLELFKGISVLENIQIASDTRRWFTYVSDLVRPRVWSSLSSLAVEVIDEFALAGHLDSLPTSLSNGQRRLVGFARSIAAGPKVLLLDEPAAGLDDGESSALIGAIRNLAEQRGLAVLLVEHDMTVVMAACDRIVAISAGKVIAEGTPTEIARNSQVLNAYLGASTLELPEPALSHGSDVRPGTVMSPATGLST